MDDNPVSLERALELLCATEPRDGVAAHIKLDEVMPIMRALQTEITKQAAIIDDMMRALNEWRTRAEAAEAMLARG